MTVVSPTPSAQGAFDSEHDLQVAAAARRLQDRSTSRRQHEEVLARSNGLAEADDPERIRKRLARIADYYSPTAQAQPQPTIELGVEETAAAVAAPSAELERIINTADFLGVRYLDDGVLAARAIGRVQIGAASGHLQGYGTGFLVTPDLLLTNHHVLPDAQTARISLIEFDYQDGAGGTELSSHTYQLNPDKFFVADRQRDFALVAVTDDSGTLKGYGFNRLTAAQGTVIIGENVTIVQHPGGRKKQIVLRENKLIDIPDGFVHYSADTEPGSSGSPVFNDQWEVVALHHASVPAPERSEFGGFLNEGVRISSILNYLRTQSFTTEQQALLDVLLGPAGSGRSEAAPTAAAAPARQPRPPELAVDVPDGVSTIRLPLEITFRVAEPTPITMNSVAAEAISIDPDYSTRAGYDPGFLDPTLRAPLPTVGPELVALASSELRYHHFSVVMNRVRRMAMFTAVNIDGNQPAELPRESDRWIADPRLPAGEQTDKELYLANNLDRGHLVRRLDPAWGPNAKAANDDTFHFTNCTPQHHEFNAGSTLWLGLEDYVLRNSATHGLKVSVLTGPVLAADDPPYRGVSLPRQFWKVVTIVTDRHTLASTAYLLSQAALLDEFAAGPESFSYGAYRTYQVPVRRIADLTGLELSPYIAADPLEHVESTGTPRELIRPENLILC
uniref:DNA/RNA non-specific endonuclease n=1 Tax=Gordonia sp. B7-2 TaxID=3420932 RepID=UPI003D926D6A